MTRRLLSICTAATMLTLSAPALAFRCGEGGHNLASEGMHKYQIQKDCGPPDSKEVVGVDEDKSTQRDSRRIVEEWIYVLRHYHPNQTYLIRFDRNGVAREIVYLGNR